MKQLIINADDFGLSDGICRSIHELLDAGAITSTSLMLCAKDAIRRIKRWNPSRLLGTAGVHLQLTSGCPLTLSMFTSGQEEDGQFDDPRTRTTFSESELKKIAKEWKLQIDVACDLLCGLPTHLDSHHGVHRIREIFPIYMQLAMEYGLPMRGANDGEIKDQIVTNRLPATVAIVRNWTGRNLCSDKLLEYLKEVEVNNIDENIVEIVAHPGYSDAYLESVSSLSKARGNDYDVLLHLSKTKSWDMLGYRLTSYKDYFNGKTFNIS